MILTIFNKQNQMSISDQELNELIAQYNTIECPFVGHVDYFKGNDGKITSSSIATKWSELSNEWYLKTYIKGEITMRGANYGAKTCPYKYKFNPDDMMSALKHPCDTGIVNKNGSINIDILKQFIKDNFIFHEENNGFILMKSTMDKYVEKCCLRDKDMNLKLGWNVPSCDTVARAEWYDFFLNYTDTLVNCKSHEEQAVTIDTFLKFYFQPKELYNKVLGNKKN